MTEYGDKLTAVEPGGIEPVADADRHGRPRQLFWTWASPNLEFATIYLGVLAVSAFGLSFWQAVLATALGNLLASAAHAVLSARGVDQGVPQMVLGRAAFGRRGNFVPSALTSVMAGAGWFAVNSVSAAFALNTLTGVPVVLCLSAVMILQVAIAYFGHNLVQAYQKYVFAVLAVVFVMCAVVVFSRSSPGAVTSTGGVGGFLLAVGASFGYTAGWNPYAADYTRYLPLSVSRRAVGLFAGSGLFIATTGLMAVGAASATTAGISTGSPTADFTGSLPGFLAAAVLLAVTLGAVAANVLNVYSGALSFLALGIRLPMKRRRAVVALSFGVLGFFLALLGLGDAGHAYESFLLVIAYWISPWLAVILLSGFGFRGPGLLAFGVGLIVSVTLFANQELYRGILPRLFPDLGDVTFVVGFALSALIFLAARRRT